MSPTWTRNLPPKDEMQSLPIRRVPTSSNLVALITTDDLLGTFTHFYHGRTIPCERPDCEPCNNGLPYRYHAYVAAYNPTHNTHFIFEMTAQAAEVLVKYRDAHLTLRGCKITAFRWGQRPNGRVILKTEPGPIPVTELPAAPDMIRCLSTLWNLPIGPSDSEIPLKHSPRVALHHPKETDPNGRPTLDIPSSIH